MVNPSLEVRDLFVRYPRSQVDAVQGVSLGVDQGSVLGLLGPSGCGKSTLLSAIAGLVPLSRGQVIFDGTDVTTDPPERRRFGLVFQDGQLFPHLNVGDNIAFGLRMLGWKSHARTARVTELLDLVGLPDSHRRKVTELSGGERQRIALARSLASRPRLLMLDEPFSGLDATLRARMAADVADIIRSEGTTAILVTHDAAEATAVCDKVLRMDKGRLM